MLWYNNTLADFAAWGPSRPFIVICYWCLGLTALFLCGAYGHYFNTVNNVDEEQIAMCVLLAIYGVALIVQSLVKMRPRRNMESTELNSDERAIDLGFSGKKDALGGLCALIGGLAVGIGSWLTYTSFQDTNVSNTVLYSNQSVILVFSIIMAISGTATMFRRLHLFGFFERVNVVATVGYLWATAVSAVQLAE